MAGREDLVLTEQARARVADVFESNRRYIEAIAIQQVGGDHTEAAEVVQDVALRLCRKLHTFRHSAALRTWLYRVTVNAARDRLAAERRRGRGRVELDAHELEEAHARHDPDTVLVPDDVVRDAEVRQVVRRAVAGLAAPERLVLHARFGLGVFRAAGPQSLAEAGQAFEISRSAVHKREALALDKLRARLRKRRADLA